MVNLSSNNKNNESFAHFSFETVQRLYETQELIDFDIAWQVLGYSRKDSAKRTLKSHFEREFDYFVQGLGESLKLLPYGVFHIGVEPPLGGRPTEKIYLTVECFKEMGMLAKSEEGKRIRKYFLQCEAIAKESVKAIPQMQQQMMQMQQQIAALQSQIQPLLPADSNTPPPGWNPEVWQQLAPEDKRHFRFLYRRRGFYPSHQFNEPLVQQELTQEARNQQHVEVEAIQGEASEDERTRIEAAKEEAFAILDSEEN